jgi:hypothetical protein
MGRPEPPNGMGTAGKEEAKTAMLKQIGMAEEGEE